MRAKLINEIKQHIEGSGLGPIGIGVASMFKGYNEIKKIIPDFKKLSYPIKNNPMADEIEGAILQITSTFKCKEDDLILLLNKLDGIEMLRINNFINNVVLGIDNFDDLITRAGRLQTKKGSFEEYYILLSTHWQIAKISIGNITNKEYYLIRYK